MHPQNDRINNNVTTKDNFFSMTIIFLYKIAIKLNHIGKKKEKVVFLFFVCFEVI